MSKQVIHRKRKIPKKNLQTTIPPEGTEKTAATENYKPKYWLLFILALITFATYTPSLKNKFTNWDDKSYVVNNPMAKELNLENIKEIFFSQNPKHRYWMGNYHPLTMLSLTITYQMSLKNGEPQPWIFILTNIILHILNTLLVFFIILHLSKNNFIAFVVALLFGVHTLHVESVAWIAERKDVLYTFFYLWALLAYIKYIRKNKIGLYIFSLFLFFLSLLSKGQAVSLALTIILIDIFYKRKIFSIKSILEKIPFFILALIFGLIAIEAQKNSSALQTSEMYPLIKRIGIASYAYAVYLFKLILPIHLSAIYPYPDIINKTIPFYYYLFAIVDIAVLALMFLWYKKEKLLPALGLAFFTVNIAFLLQLIPVGSAIYADRYTYIPSIGFYLVIAYFLQKLKEKNLSITIIALSAYTILLIVLTILRIQVWHDSKSLWTDTIKKTPKAVIAWNNLGSVISQEANDARDNAKPDSAVALYRKAIKHFDRAIKRKPDYSSAFYNRAVAKYEIAKILNDTSLALKAIDDLNKAIAVKLDFKDAFLERGVIYDWLNKLPQAYSDYQRVLMLDPNNTNVLVNLGIYYGKKGMYDTAITYFNKVIRLKNNSSEAYSNRGLAYMLKGQLDSALKDFNKAIDLSPTYASTYYNRALVYIRKKQFNKALEDLNRAIELLPQNPEFYFIRGNVYIELNNREQACKNYSIAAKFNYPPAKGALQKYCKN